MVIGGTGAGVTLADLCARRRGVTSPREAPHSVTSCERTWTARGARGKERKALVRDDDNN